MATTNVCDDCHVVAAWTTVHFDHADAPGDLRQLPQRHDRAGKPGQPHQHHQCLRRLPRRRQLDDGQRRPRRRHRDLRQLPQRHDRDRQAGQPRGHHRRLRRLSHDADLGARTFNHANVTPGTCASCHNGSAATGQPANHFVTTLSCDDCHNTANWTTVIYHHTGATYPGDHGASVTCASCHTSNSATIVYPYAAYAPDCAGCHAKRSALTPTPSGRARRPSTTRSRSSGTAPAPVTSTPTAR